MRGIRTVYLDQRTQPGQTSIIIDNVGGARMAVAHLVGHGRTRIAHIGGLEGSPGANARVLGWEEECAAAGLDTEGLLIRSAFSRAGGLRAGRELLCRKTRPDAIFVASDVQALGLLAAAREAQVRVPEDLAVISFDGTTDAIFSVPPLTAVEQPITALASAALAAVLPERRAPSEAIPVSPSSAVLPVSLAVRDSCGCPSDQVAG